MKSTQHSPVHDDSWLDDSWLESARGGLESRRRKAEATAQAHTKTDQNTVSLDETTIAPYIDDAGSGCSCWMLLALVQTSRGDADANADRFLSAGSGLYVGLSAGELLAAFIWPWS